MCGSVFSSVNHPVRFSVCSPGLPDSSRVAAHRTFDGQSHRQIRPTTPNNLQNSTPNNYQNDIARTIPFASRPIIQIISLASENSNSNLCFLMHHLEMFL